MFEGRPSTLASGGNSLRERALTRAHKVRLNVGHLVLVLHLGSGHRQGRAMVAWTRWRGAGAKHPRNPGDPINVAASLSYDRTENIIHMSFSAPEKLDTRAQIAEHFERVLAFWRTRAGGKKTYFVVNFDNITININELDFYAEQSKRAHDLCAITSVRYGGNSLQRTVTRLAGMKIHRPSNIYETREEALAVIRALRKGDIKAKPAAPQPRR